jgi:hypothetical protein
MAHPHATRKQAEDEAPQAGGAWKFFVAVAILCALVIGYYAYSAWSAQREREASRYNGFDFAQSAEGFWVTRIETHSQPYDIPFYYHPRETESVVVHAGVTDPVLRPKPSRIFISIDPDAGSTPVLGAVEIARITGYRYDLLNIPTSSALSRAAETKVDIPIINCNNVSLIAPNTTVIQFVQDPAANAIVRDGPCVILFYKDANESVRVADRYAYQLLRIMK